MARQLTFDLPVRAALGRDDYFVSPANEVAVNTVLNWQGWPDGKMALCGPSGSGKTHLAHVWAADAGAMVIPAATLANADIAALVARSSKIAVEDVDEITGDADSEQALFHLHNLILAEGGHLLVSGTASPAAWPLTLPDLKSRMQGTDLVQLSAPDDLLLSAVMVKLFADRQVEAAPDVIQYLAPRIERSFDAAGQVVAALDALALSEGRAITRPLAIQLMGSFSSENA